MVFPRNKFPGDVPVGKIIRAEISPSSNRDKNLAGRLKGDLSLIRSIVQQRNELITPLLRRCSSDFLNYRRTLGGRLDYFLQNLREHPQFDTFRGPDGTSTQREWLNL